MAENLISLHENNVFSNNHLHREETFNINKRENIVDSKFLLLLSQLQVSSSSEETWSGACDCKQIFVFSIESNSDLINTAHAKLEDAAATLSHKSKRVACQPH